VIPFGSAIPLAHETHKDTDNFLSRIC
jgi:hypothetical protein